MTIYLFLIIFYVAIAWMLFAAGFINIFREAYTYATNSASQHGDWLGIIRALCGALCLTGWWFLILLSLSQLKSL